MIDKNIYVKNNEPLVSVIIITYNQKKFIYDSVMSVITQTYNNFEIIIADDGSNDGSHEIIKKLAYKFSDKIVLAISDINEGIAANYNRGLKLAKGKYIAWLGGDDIMFPEKISTQVLVLNEQLNAVGCVHDAEVFQSETGELLGLFSEWANSSLGLKNGGVELWFEQGYHMLPSTVMFRANAVSFHKFDIRLKYTNDWLFDVEIFQQGRVIALNKVLGKYRRHKNNVTSSKALNDIAIEDNLIAISIVEARYPQLSGLVRKKRQIILLSACKSHWFVNKNKALLYLKSAFYAGGLISLLMILGQWIFKNLILRKKKLYERR